MSHKQDEQLAQMEPAVEPTSEPAAQSAAEFSENGFLTGHAIKAYGSQMHPRREDERILQYLPLVHRIVSQVAGYLQPPLSREDLISAGTIGLIKAARDFDATRDAEFKTYAYIRIRGAVIDELRGWSFAPPGVKKMIDRVHDLAATWMNERGTMPTDEELAEKMGLEPEKLMQIYETARARHFLSISGMEEEGPALGSFLAADTPQPDSRAQQQELKKQLSLAMRSLPEKQRQIILLYYHRELTMKQIAEVMELTESRISQLHAAALFKMSLQMKQWNDAQSGQLSGA